jgi:catalase
LARVDARLCSEVAAGLGLPVPEFDGELPEVTPSPALSQIGQRWPVEGRIVGIVTDHGVDGVAAVRDVLVDAGVVPLVIAPHGGPLTDGLVAQRTFLTARSVEFDALLVAAAPPPAPDALPARDAKAGAPASTVDPRVALLVEEAHRHAKAIGAWGEGVAVVGDGPGVVTGDNPTEVVQDVLTLLSEHRVWPRLT